MTINEFNSVLKETQINILWEYGVMIGEREDEDCLYVLYSLGSFYVELRYFNCSLVTIKSFNDINLLEPYLLTISINSIYSYLGQ